jgi:phytoene dehydrogenase-like protein
VEFRFGAEAVRVVEKDGRAAGVEFADGTVTVLRPGDPALRPDDDHESAVLTATVPAGTGPEEAGRLAEAMLTAAEAAVPGLRERLLWHEVRTPADTRGETGAEGVPAPALAGGGAARLHPGNATGLPNLFRVGGWSHPGGGLPHAGMSGALVAGLVVEGPGFRGSR